MEQLASIHINEVCIFANHTCPFDTAVLGCKKPATSFLDQYGSPSFTEADREVHICGGFSNSHGKL